MEHQTLNFTMEIIFDAVTSYVDDEKPQNHMLSATSKCSSTTKTQPQ